MAVDVIDLTPALTSRPFNVFPRKRTPQLLFSSSAGCPGAGFSDFDTDMEESAGVECARMSGSTGLDQ